MKEQHSKGNRGRFSHRKLYLEKPLSLLIFIVIEILLMNGNVNGNGEELYLFLTLPY